MISPATAIEAPARISASVRGTRLTMKTVQTRSLNSPAIRADTETSLTPVRRLTHANVATAALAANRVKLRMPDSRAT